MNPASESFLSKWPIFSLLDETFRRSIKLVCVFGGSGNEAIMLTGADEMFSLGANSNGCLGVGSGNGCLQPRKMDSMSGKNVVDIAFGSGLHVVALTTSGKLFSWGNNSYGQLGHSSVSSSDPVPVPFPVAISQRVVKVACGGHHSLAVTEDGNVYSWGYNNCGQLGTGNTANQRLPVRVSALDEVRCTMVCCTHASSFTLSAAGDLYSWGYNGNGQLGVGTNINSHTPTRVHMERPLQQVACGYAHVLGLGGDGVMYSWGSNFHGQLGTNNKTNHLMPIPVTGDLSGVVQVAASHDSHISCSALVSGKVYMWGMCKGQCLLAPYETNFSSLDDVFACFSQPPSMWRAIAPVNEDSYSLTQCIADRFNDTSTADLTIIVEGRRIHVHKAILRMRCDYFHSMFQQGRWTEADKDCIEIGQFPYSVYHTFLKFLYTDKLEDISTEEALGLLELTDSYCEKDLKRHCERLIWQNVTVDNVLAILASASKFRATTLEEQCMDFALGRMTQVVQSEVFDQEDPVFIKLFIKKAAERGAFKT